MARIWCRSAAVGAAVVSMAASASGQWDQLPAATVEATEAFHVIAGSGGQAHAFSAMAQSWLPLGIVNDDPNIMAPAVRTGDWTALVRTSPGGYRAYSARLHDYADIQFTDHPDQILICVEDDVILIVGNRPGQASTQACAYSAQTNRWRFVNVGSAGARNHACSRFVAGVIRASDNRAFGFSARRGEWVGTGGNAVCTLQADGNVLLIDNPAPVAAKAFSGVLGEWAASPLQHPGSVEQIDHNVAFVREDSGGSIPFLAAYSAYTGTWVRGSASQGPVTLGDNVVHAHGLANPHRQFAFGAWPGVWQNTSLPSGAMFGVQVDDDLVVVHDVSNAQAHAFSGVVVGTWQSQGVSAGSSVFVADHLAVGDLGSLTVAYSAGTAQWAAPILHGSGAMVSTDGVSFFYGSGGRTAFATRGGDWVHEVRSAGTHIQMTGFHFVTEYDQTAEEQSIFHERLNAWVKVPLRGAGSLSRYTKHQNLLLASYGGVGFELVGISAQRGDAVPAPGFVAPRAAWGIDENVGWALDAQGTLHAFGSPDATHSWFQYPLDSEMQVFTAAGATAVPSKIMVRGAPGETAVLMIGFTRFVPPVVFPGIGDMHVSSVVSAPVGVLGANGLLVAPAELGLAGVPGTFELYIQSYTDDGMLGFTLVGESAEPLRYH